MLSIVTEHDAKTMFKIRRFHKKAWNISFQLIMKDFSNILHELFYQRSTGKHPTQFYLWVIYFQLIPLRLIFKCRNGMTFKDVTVSSEGPVSIEIMALAFRYETKYNFLLPFLTFLPVFVPPLNVRIYS